MKKIKYKAKVLAKTFFGEESRLDKLSKLGDRLLKLNSQVNWDIFRPLLEKNLYKVNEFGGRPPYDYILMVKILILQRYYNISDDEIEYQLNDRLSFQRFLNLSLDDDIPDAKTIWNFREQLKKKNLIKKLFRLFLKEIQSNGLIGKKGVMVDASFVEVPIQRNSKDENKEIRNGRIPNWENKNKRRQKDIEASWTKKNDQKYFGYKNHVKADKKSKIILDYGITPASVHDSMPVECLLSEKDDKGQSFFGDSAYVGPRIEKILKKFKMKNKIIEKGYRNRPLTKKQIKRNKKKSSTRVRVEHIFGFIENSMGGSFMRSIGLSRADANIGLMNLTYNMFRSLQIS